MCWDDPERAASGAASAHMPPVVNVSLPTVSFLIRWVSVSETSQLQAMAQNESGLVGESSGWKLIDLECVTGSDQLTGGSSPPDLPGKGGGLISP